MPTPPPPSASLSSKSEHISLSICSFFVSKLTYSKTDDYQLFPLCKEKQLRLFKMTLIYPPLRKEISSYCLEATKN